MKYLVVYRFNRQLTGSILVGKAGRKAFLQPSFIDRHPTPSAFQPSDVTWSENCNVTGTSRLGLGFPFADCAHARFSHPLELPIINARDSILNTRRFILTIVKKLTDPLTHGLLNQSHQAPSAIIAETLKIIIPQQ